MLQSLEFTIVNMGNLDKIDKYCFYSYFSKSDKII